MTQPTFFHPVRGIFALAAVFCLSLSVQTSYAQEPQQAHSGSSQAASSAKTEKAKVPLGDPYTLATCPVTKQKLGSMGEPVIYDLKGREIRFCCKGCVKKFEKNTEEYVKWIDENLAKRQESLYPIKTCVISGGKLGGMGDPLNYIYKNRLVRFCCKGCVKKFEADPAKHLAALDKAVIAKQTKDYPLATCAVSGQKLGSMGDPLDVVIGNRLVRLCCKGCVKSLRKDPLKYFSKLDVAEKAEESQ